LCLNFHGVLSVQRLLNLGKKLARFSEKLLLLSPTSVDSRGYFFIQELAKNQLSAIDTIYNICYWLTEIYTRLLILPPPSLCVRMVYVIIAQKQLAYAKRDSSLLLKIVESISANFLTALWCNWRPSKNLVFLLLFHSGVRQSAISVSPLFIIAMSRATV